jgi:sugar (pentulose or hexulose) kinase
MKKLLLLTAAIAAGAIFGAPVRAEDQSEAPAAASAAPAETAAPSAPAETSAPAAESKPVIPPDSEWVHPTK